MRVKFFLAFVLALIAIGVVQRKALGRIAHFVLLFHPSQIEHNFRSSTAWNVPYRTLRRGNAPIAKLGQSEKRALPETFEHDGKTFNTSSFLEAHWTTGMVVLKVDSTQSARVLHEHYARGNDASSSCISWSVGKSFVSAAFGKAVDLGLISTEDKVEKHLPWVKGSAYEGVRLKDVLQMSSGVKFDENYFAPFSDINVMGYWLALGWPIQQFIERLTVRQKEPGTFNHYVSMDTQILGMAVAAAANSTLSHFMEEHLWSKVGFEADASFLLDNDEQRVELSFGTLGLRTRDYARFGWFVLNQGKSPATGQQVVSQQWMVDSVTPDAPHLMPNAFPSLSNAPFFGYGYQYWVAPEEHDPAKFSPSFMAIGVYNQFIGVFPREGIVIAKNSAWPGYPDDGLTLKSEIETFKCFRTIAKAFASA